MTKQEEFIDNKLSAYPGAVVKWKELIHSPYAPGPMFSTTPYQSMGNEMRGKLLAIVALLKRSRESTVYLTFSKEELALQNAMMSLILSEFKDSIKIDCNIYDLESFELLNPCINEILQISKFYNLVLDIEFATMCWENKFSRRLSNMTRDLIEAQFKYGNRFGSLEHGVIRP